MNNLYREVIKDTIKQYNIPKGDKVVMRDSERDFINMTFLGMDGAYGRWQIGEEVLIGNYKGLFHRNNSQKYWYYQPDKE